MATIGWLAPTYDGANTLSARINVDARLPKNVNEVIANQETFFCLTITEWALSKTNFVEHVTMHMILFAMKFSCLCIHMTTSTLLALIKFF